MSTVSLHRISNTVLFIGPSHKIILFYRERKVQLVQLAAMASKAQLVFLALLDLQVLLERMETRSVTSSYLDLKTSLSNGCSCQNIHFALSFV